MRRSVSVSPPPPAPVVRTTCLASPLLALPDSLLSRQYLSCRRARLVARG